MRLTPLLAITAVLAALLVGAFAALAALPHTQAYQPNDQDTLLQPSACDTWGCGLNIYPGETDLNEAIDALEASPWAENVRYYRSMEMDAGYLHWDWTGEQPDYINPARRGVVWLQRGYVRWLEIGARARFGDVWLALAQPDYGGIHTTSALPEQVYQVATYHQGLLLVRNEMRCPFDAAQYWRSAVILRINSLEESYLVRRDEDETWQMPDMRLCG